MRVIIPNSKIILKALVLFYLLYFAFQILSAQDFYQFARVDYLKNVNIVFHEAGHTVFALFGDFLRTLGGSFLQVFLPLMLAVYFFIWRKEIFSLGNPDGGRAGHDWRYLLSTLGVLDKTDAISGAVYFFGTTIFILAFVSMISSIYRDRQNTNE